jgi:hypothetical protein
VILEIPTASAEVAFAVKLEPTVVALLGVGETKSRVGAIESAVAPIPDPVRLLIR